MDENLSMSNIKDTSNGTSDIDVASSSNGIISALRSRINILSSSNFKVGGQDHKQISLDSCSNVSLEGSNGCLQLKKTSNAKVTGVGNQVQVESASNLVIQGNGNNVELKNLSNHVMQPTVNKDMNVFEVKTGADSLMGRLTALIGAHSTSNSKKISVDYVDCAKVDGPEYKLGIYKLHVNASSPFYVDVRVDSSAVDALHTISNPNGSSVQLEGSNHDGLAQKLVLKGPKISQTEENTFRIDLNNRQGSL